jgi:hypothetical protein
MLDKDFRGTVQRLIEFLKKWLFQREELEHFIDALKVILY